jgi:hypothetical protein
MAHLPKLVQKRMTERSLEFSLCENLNREPLVGTQVGTHWHSTLSGRRCGAGGIGTQPDHSSSNVIDLN